MTEEHQFVYDLMSELRTDPRRRKAVMNRLRDIDIITEDIANGKATRDDLTAAEADLIPLSGFNFGLLIPRVFPRYPLDKPLDFASRPFMFAMTSMTPNSVVTLKAGRQVGKCADGDTEVITRTGTTTLASLFEEGIAA